LGAARTEERRNEPRRAEKRGPATILSERAAAVRWEELWCVEMSEGEEDDELTWSIGAAYLSPIPLRVYTF
jgi:hypothetical protein